MLYKILLFALAVVRCSSTDNCDSRKYEYDSVVCVCNSDHCHSLKPIIKDDSSVYIYTSNKDGLRFEEEKGTFSSSIDATDNLILIGTETFQEIFGFGGAFTDSTGINLKAMSEDLQQEILKSYFTQEGLEYTTGRVPIGGTDFSTHGYSYCDTEDDKPDLDLVNFQLAPEDHSYKIPYIQEAINLTNGNIKLVASAWIAPGWMKTSPDVLSKFSFIKEDMYQVWADYHVRFFEEYQKNTINFWGVTTNNEPTTAFVSKLVPSVAWFPNLQSKWIKENFGPAMRSSSYSDLKILAHDDSSQLLPIAVEMLLEDDETKHYIDGFGVHWYVDFLFGTGGVESLHKLYPDKFILLTEASNGYITQHVSLGSWFGAERYANDIIANMNHWAIGWTDWNMVLDLQGGPTFIDNFLDAPIIVNATGNEFFKQPSYYALAHFSKFLTRGSVRLQVTANIHGVEIIAAKRPDNGIAVVILNTNDHAVSAILRDKAGDIDLNISEKSITSIIYWE